MDIRKSITNIWILLIEISYFLMIMAIKLRFVITTKRS